MLANSPEWQRSVRNNDLIAMRGMLMTRSPSPRRQSNTPPSSSYPSAAAASYNQYNNYDSSATSRYNNGGGDGGFDDPTYLKPSQKDEGSMLFERNGAQKHTTTRGNAPQNVRKEGLFAVGAKDAPSSSDPHQYQLGTAVVHPVATAASPFLLDADAKVAYYKALLVSKQETNTEKSIMDSSNGAGALGMEGRVGHQGHASASKVSASSEDQEREEASSVAVLKGRHRVFEERFGGGAQQSLARSAVVSPERKAYTAFSERRDRIVGASSLASSQAASDALKRDTRTGHHKAATYGAAPRSLLDFALADQLGLNTVPNSSLSKPSSSGRQTALPSSSRGVAFVDSRDGHHTLPSSVRALALAAAEAEAQRERYRLKILNNGVSPSREHDEDGEEKEREQRIAFNQDHYHTYETEKSAPSGSNAVAAKKKVSSSIAEEAMRAVDAAAAGVLSYHPTNIVDPTPHHSFYPTAASAPSARSNHNNKGHLNNNSSVINTSTSNHTLSLAHSSSLASNEKEEAGIFRYKSEFAAAREAERQRELYYQRRLVISPETAAAMIATGQDESFERECLIEVEHQEWRRLMIIAGDDCEAQMAKLRLRERKALFDEEAEERVVLADQYSVSYSHLLHFVKRLEALQWPFSLLYAKERHARETIHVIEERYRRDLMSSLELLTMGSDSVVDTLRKAKLIMQARLLSTADEKLVGALVTRAESDADRADAMQRALEYDNAVRAALRFVSPIRGSVGTESGVVVGGAHDLHDNRHHHYNASRSSDLLRQATGHNDDGTNTSYPHHHSNYYPNGLRFFSESGNEVVDFEDITVLVGSGVGRDGGGGGDADLRSVFGRGGTKHNTSSSRHDHDDVDRFQTFRKRDERPIEDQKAAVVWGNTFQYRNPTQQDEASPARPFYFPESGTSGSAAFMRTTNWRPEARTAANRNENKTEREQEVDSVAKELLAERFAFEESSRQQYREEKEKEEREEEERKKKKKGEEYRRQQEIQYGGGTPEDATKPLNPATTHTAEDVHRNVAVPPSPNYSPLLLSETRKVALIFSSPTSDIGDFGTEAVIVKGNEEVLDVNVSEGHYAPFGYYSPSPPPHPETRQRDRGMLASNTDHDDGVNDKTNRNIQRYEETSSSLSSSSSSRSSVAVRGKSTVSLVIEEDQLSEALPPQRPYSAPQHEYIPPSAAGGGDSVVVNSFYSSYSHSYRLKSLDTEEEVHQKQHEEGLNVSNTKKAETKKMARMLDDFYTTTTAPATTRKLEPKPTHTATDTTLPFSSFSSLSNPHAYSHHHPTRNEIATGGSSPSIVVNVINNQQPSTSTPTAAATAASTQLTPIMPSSPTTHTTHPHVVALDQERDRVLRSTFVSMLASQGTKLEEILREQRALSAERRRRYPDYDDNDEDVGGVQRGHHSSPQRQISLTTTAHLKEEEKCNDALLSLGERDVIVRERDSSVEDGIKNHNKTDRNANRTTIDSGGRCSEYNEHDDCRSQEGATDSEAEVPPPDAKNTSTRPPTPTPTPTSSSHKSSRNTEKRPFTSERQHTQTKTKTATNDFVVSTGEAATNSDLLFKEQSLRISSYAEAIHRLAKEHRAKKDSTTTALQQLSSQPATSSTSTAVSRSASTTTKTAATRANDDTRKGRSQEHASNNDHHHQRRRQNESNVKNTDDDDDDYDQQMVAAAVVKTAPQKTYLATSLPTTPRKHRTSALLHDGGSNGGSGGGEHIKKVREVPSLASSRSGTPTMSRQSMIAATTPTTPNTIAKGNTLRNPRQTKHHEEQLQQLNEHPRSEANDEKQHFCVQSSSSSLFFSRAGDAPLSSTSALRPKTPSRAASFFASATRKISSAGPSSAKASRTASTASSSSSAGCTAPTRATVSIEAAVACDDKDDDKGNSRKVEDGVKHVATTRPTAVTPPLRMRLLDANATATAATFEHYYDHSTRRENNALRVPAEMNYFTPTATSTSTTTTRAARYFEEQRHQVLEPVRPLPLPETLLLTREEQVQEIDFSPAFLSGGAILDTTTTRNYENHHHHPFMSTSTQRAPVYSSLQHPPSTTAPPATKIFGRKSATTPSAAAYVSNAAVRRRREEQPFSLQTDFLTISDTEKTERVPRQQQQEHHPYVQRKSLVMDKREEREADRRKNDEGLFSGANVMSSPQRQCRDRQYEEGKGITASSQDIEQHLQPEAISFGSPLLSSHGDDDNEGSAPSASKYWWQDRRRF